MHAARTINLTGMEHGEREKLIFPSLEALRAGEELRLVMEFNPVPLVFLLKAREGFETSFDKEGPDEWILHIKKTQAPLENKEHLKALLKELKTGAVSEEAKRNAKAFFQTIDATTLGTIEQELIREGVSHEEIRTSLCDIHLDVMREALASKRIEVAAPHPIHTLMEEHKAIVGVLNELGGAVEDLKTLEGFEALSDAGIEKLRDIARRLLEAESHHQREEDCLFPALRSHNVVEPPDIMQLEHREFRKKKKDLHAITQNPRDLDFNAFRAGVIELGSYISKELESHIFKEDNILYQIALQTLDGKEWEEIKKGCDAIGYCCFTPDGPAQGKPDEIELDLRPMPPFERHGKIFELWAQLKAGQTMILINDHDPKPLHYQFEGEFKGSYEWEYAMQGPADWMVRIKKTGNRPASGGL